MIDLLSVNNVIFTLFGYPMSLVEFLGTLFNLWCVWLVSVGSILTWPIGIVGVILFGVLFYQIQLYSDLLEQVYYFITGFIGWWMWKKGAKKDGEGLVVFRNTKKENLVSLVLIGIGTFLLSVVVSRVHIWFPAVFSVAASYPFLDALTTSMSFMAQWLMAKRKLESWILWIIVDVIGIGLYFAKGVVFVSLLYFVFLILASRGFFNWLKIWKSRE